MSDPYRNFIVAVCAVLLRDGKMLSMRRSASKDASPGVWEAVSGRLETGEQPLAAVCREILEETGLRAAVDPRPLQALQTTRAGIPMTVIYYRATAPQGTPRLSEEHDAWEWITPEQFAARSPLQELAAVAAAALTAPFHPGDAVFFPETGEK